MIAVQIKGVDELLKKLEGLGKNAPKATKWALRKSAVVIQQAAKQNAARIDDPKTSADIQKNIAIRFSSKLFKSSGDVGYRVGVMGGAGGNLSKKNQANGLPGGDTRHFRLVEFGSENNKADPFLRPALENNLQQATDAFVVNFDKWIAIQAKKGKT